VGGIIFSLLLTLFVVPAVYSFLSSKKKGIPKELLVEHTTETLTKETYIQAQS
jgi:multidrug efflux pump